MIMKKIIFGMLLVMTGCSVRPSQTERIVYLDEKTGNEVWQVSQGDSMSLMPYFETQGFTYDDRYAVFKSKREGDWKLFSTSIATGEVCKISDRVVDGSYSVYTTGDEVIFMERGIIYAVHVETHAERVLFDANGKIDEAAISFNALFTNDGAWMVLTGQNPDRSSSFYRLHVPTGRLEKVYSSKTGFTHPMINPVYPNLITFVPKPDKRAMYDLPKEERARGMLLNTDDGSVRPFVMSEKYYRATHETWSKDGERLYYFDKLHKSGYADPTMGWEISVVSIDKTGCDRTVHYLNNVYKLAHGIATEDQHFFVCDVDRPRNNPLYLINLTTGEAEIVCWANQTQPSLGNVQTEHVHPLFSRSGNYIAFTSDRTSPGVPQAFIVPIAKLKQKYER